MLEVRGIFEIIRSCLSFHIRKGWRKCLEMMWLVLVSFWSVSVVDGKLEKAWHLEADKPASLPPQNAQIWASYLMSTWYRYWIVEWYVGKAPIRVPGTKCVLSNCSPAGNICLHLFHPYLRVSLWALTLLNLSQCHLWVQTIHSFLVVVVFFVTSPSPWRGRAGLSSYLPGEIRCFVY